MSLVEIATAICVIPDNEPRARVHHLFVCCSDRGWPARPAAVPPAIPLLLAEGQVGGNSIRWSYTRTLVGPGHRQLRT